MKVLVTGATGFLGSYLCRRLVRDGCRVTALRRPASSTAELDGVDVRYETGDVIDRQSVLSAVTGQDVVVHAAASTAHSGVAEELQHSTNVEGTRNVAEACKLNGIRRLLHISSVAAVGITTDPARPANEDFAFNLDGSGLTYHLTKRRAEVEVLRQIKEGLDAVIVNPAQIFGTGRGGYRGAQMLAACLGRWFIPHAPGGTCNVHVLDVVDGIVRALEQGRPGERYILGGDNVSFAEMNQTVCKRLGIHRLHVPIPALVAEGGNRAKNLARRTFGSDPLPTYDRRFCYQVYESAKAQAELGYTPRAFDAIVDEWIQHLNTRSNEYRGEGKSEDRRNAIRLAR